jgi:NADH dehydrogenase [ubiquinone] 1 alpha subcomplex assembly factor 3
MNPSIIDSMLLRASRPALYSRQSPLLRRTFTSRLQPHRSTPPCTASVPQVPSTRRRISSTAATPFASNSSHAPASRDRGPPSQESTQTDFGALDVLGNVPPPASTIGLCLPYGFELANGVRVDNAGMLLLSGEVFRWTPWWAGRGKPPRKLFNGRGQWEVEKDTLGLLDLMWPRPGSCYYNSGFFWV